MHWTICRLSYHTIYLFYLLYSECLVSPFSII